MSDDRFDRMLRQAMTASLPPMLSAGFDERLAQRLPGRRLTARRRAGLTAYALAAVAISVGLMRWAAIDWRLMIVALAAPIAFAAMACRRCVTLALTLSSSSSS
jgi:hypothetical protein